MRNFKYHFLNGIKPKKCAIYKIVCPNSDVYIGKSRDLLKRWRSYVYSRKDPKGNNIKSSILMNGWANHTFSIVHELPQDVSDETLIDYEQFYIDRYIDCAFKVLNIRYSDGRHMDESIKRMKGRNGVWMKGRKQPNAMIENRIKSRKSNQKTLSCESRERYKSMQLGSKNTMSKLTEDEVLLIVKLRIDEGLLLTDISARFGVTIGTISGIINGHRWNYLTGIKKEKL